jgi:uncharacterized paraquat-inducible protein A
MYCPKCGTPNDDNAWKCVRCGAALQHAPQAPIKIPNYLAQAILCTIFCCLPFGIPAIIFAAQVNTKAAAGDIQGALDSSRKARMWCWIAFAVGVPVQLIIIAVQIIPMIMGPHYF